MSEAPFTPTGLDALPPAEVARKAESVGVTKAGMATFNVFVLSILAGSFIALGAIFATTVAAGGGELPYGVVRLLAGLVFTLGLILVVVAGAELFTGNNLIVMAWASRQVATTRLLGNWGIVWVGNFVGAFATAVLMYVSEQYTFGAGAVGQTALSIGVTKTSLGFGQAIALGMLCNALVCLAVWLSYGAHTTTDKILAIIPDCRVRGGGVRALGCEHVLHLDRASDQDRRRVRCDAGSPARPLRFDLGELLRGQPAARDDREHHRRRGHGRRGVLARVSAPASLRVAPAGAA